MLLRQLLKAEIWQLGRLLWVVVTSIAVAIFAFISTPWLALASVGSIVAAVAYGARRERLAIVLAGPPDWLIAASIVAAYILLSTIWSGDRRITALTALILALLLAAVHIVARAVDRLPADWLEHMTRSLLAAFIAALIYLLVEELSDDVIKRTLFWPFRAVRWANGAITFDRSVVVKIPPQSVKWNMPALGFLLWPALLMAALQLGWRQARVMQLVVAAAAFWVMLLSDHKTSQVAFVLAVVAFAGAHFKPSRVRLALMGLWVTAFVVVVPLAHAAFNADMHLGRRVGSTFAARIILWNVTATEFWKAPILGVGAAATKRLDNERNAITPAPTPEGFTYPLRTGPHAHDVFLQSWFELGAVGSLSFLVFGLLVLRTTRHVPPDTQPYLLATFTTVFITSAASFGLFEPWFMGAYALSAIAATLAVAYRTRLSAS